MTQIVNQEMRKRLWVIIQAAQDIHDAAVHDNFSPQEFQKQMDEIRQYEGLAGLDFDYLKNPDSKVCGPIASTTNQSSRPQ